MNLLAKIYKVILFLIFFLSSEIHALAKSSNKIVVSVNNQIVSSYELKNKIKTTLFLNNQLINQQNIDLFKKQALQQLIDYKLKKNQVEKITVPLNSDLQLNKYLTNVSNKYQTDISGLKKIFTNNGLDFELYIEEIRNEFNWQKLIVSKFKNKINIDEREINNELNKFMKEQSDLYQYKLSEIEILLNNDENDKSILKEIDSQINKIGFERAAAKYSMSSSSLEGGNLGWINSKSLTKEILIIIEKLKIGEISKPIIQTNTATILKLNDKKTLNVSNKNLDKIRQQIIKNKTNELLNLHSNNYLSKIKNNALIELK